MTKDTITKKLNKMEMTEAQRAMLEIARDEVQVWYNLDNEELARKTAAQIARELGWSGMLDNRSKLTICPNAGSRFDSLSRTYHQGF